MEITKSEVYDYIESMIGIGVNDNTRFFDDVGIDGLDAEQMMFQLSEKYHIDLSNYDPSKYHFDEADIANIFPPIWRMIRGGMPKYSSFTALHLYNVVKAGKWFLPPQKENKSHDNEETAK